MGSSKSWKTSGMSKQERSEKHQGGIEVACISIGRRIVLYRELRMMRLSTAAHYENVILELKTLRSAHA
jgi:hypothetical protein